MKRYSIWMTVLLILGGCSITREVPPPVTYHLQTQSTAPLSLQTPCKKRVLRVALIESPKWLRGTEIYYSGEQSRMYRYTRARWQMSPTDQLQQVVENSISDSGLFQAVIPYKSLVKNDWLLEIRVEKLSQTVQNDGSGRTEFKAYAVLLEQYSRRVLSQKTFDYRHKQARGDVESAMQAWSKDTDTFKNDLLQWLAGSCETIGEKGCIDGTI